MNQYYVVLDIETTGFPLNWESPLTDFENWPDIIEFAWQIFDHNRIMIREESDLIKSSQQISQEVQTITGLTAEQIIEKGIDIKVALEKFVTVLKTFNPAIVAHNCEFDLKVIQSAFLKYKINVSVFSYAKICTMEESTDFCNLPELKFPKLTELYKILFRKNPSKSHRALDDVATTTEIFFKLVDLKVIKLNVLPPNNPTKLDLNVLSTEQIQNAIANYITDLNDYPIFYDFNNVNILKEDSFIGRIRDRYNKFYQTHKAKAFEIPYNLVFSRIVLALHPEDIVIRYLLVNSLKERTNFIKSQQRNTIASIRSFCEKQIEAGNGVFFKVDINNCYESIDHQILIQSVSKDLHLNSDGVFINVLNNALQVVFENHESVSRLEKGLLIGSRPDEYLAEYFLDKVEGAIREKGIPVVRITDEFILFARDISKAREFIPIVEKLCSDFCLSINRSKTIVTDHRKNIIDKKFDLKVIMSGATDPFFAYKLAEIDFENNSQKSEGFPDNLTDREDKEIDNYDSALSFLQNMLSSQNNIIYYQAKHPEFRYLYNIVYSQPTDFLIDFKHLDKSAFKPDNVRKLKKVIFYYPKSEYYSALAVQLLTFIATNTVHVVDRMDLNNKNPDTRFSSKYDYLTESCEIANSSIIEILQSNDIHEYQKYLLLRCLFKKKNILQLDIEAYEIKKVQYHFFDGDVTNEVPYKQKALDEVIRLQQTTSHFALRSICYEIVRSLIPQL